MNDEFGSMVESSAPEVTEILIIPDGELEPVAQAQLAFPFVSIRFLLDRIQFATRRTLIGASLNGV